MAELSEQYPWMQQPGESPQAYEAFRVYLRVRAVRAAADELEKNVNLIGRWSARWGWVDRVRLYDNHMASEQSTEFMDELSEVRTSHLKLSAKLLKHLDTRLDEYIAKNVDPTMRWITAFREAAGVQQRALQMRETDAADSATVDKIVAVLRERVEG